MSSLENCCPKGLSKADTLEFFREKLTHATVLPVFQFSLQQWHQQQNSLVEQILSQLPGPFVVRSSAADEDQQNHSMAGAYLSVLNVVADPTALCQSIDAVFASYQREHPQERVFVQPMLLNTDCAGVLFTQEPVSGAPYYLISVDHSGGTDTVTAGRDNSATTYVIEHNCSIDLDWHRQLIGLAKELQKYYPGQALDIEFAFSKEQLFLFQVRTLSTHPLSEMPIDAYLLEQRCIQKKLNRLTQRHPYLLGDQGIYGVMPDWNPAEIIGIKPRPLALSLYKELVTDSIWAHQRFNYGYRDLRGFPLLLVLGGTPFIDIRVSFNSFIPADLDQALADRLVNFYLNKLRSQPHLHDKVEFDIVYSCYSFDLPLRMEELKSAGFTPTELQQISHALLELTNAVIADETGVWKQDLQRITELTKRQQDIQQSQLNKLDKIYWLLEDCKRFGTLAFAGLARAGFIAMQLLNSLRSTAMISASEHQQFLLSVRTVSSDLIHDLHQLEQTDFLTKYGHLRPGTYDILSPRYDEAAAVYFGTDTAKREQQQPPEQNFHISLNALNRINQNLQSAGFKVDAIALFNFIKKAIEAREYSKFVFTRSLSDALVLIEALGNQLGLDKTKMAFADIKDILKLHSTTLSAFDTLTSSIQLGQQYHQLCQWIKLPVLIRTEAEANYFQLLPGEPNFITTGSILAPCCNAESTTDLHGKIVLIEAADPGYDWLFSKNIAGLITKFGGCNSHMAIRAAELGIPAVIGAGEQLYLRWQQANVLQLDCQSRKVTVIQ
ncbi:MAG: phosphoenolpyruvate synthase [Gammaproteobacteria bacterium]|nr:phosphoenolpyruvate synthase [Gammaproteobacteria bacterium]